MAVDAGQRRGPAIRPAATAINTHTAHRGMDERSLPDLFGPDFEVPNFPDESGEFLRLLDCGGGGGSLLTSTCYGQMSQGVSSCLAALRSTFLYAVRIRFYNVTRKCSRPVCKEDASMTLTYQYSRALVWIDDLTQDSDPHAYDLCEQHGRRLTVPGGWRMEDRRDRFRLIVPNRLAG